MASDRVAQSPTIAALLADPTPAAAAALLQKAHEHGGPLVDPLPGEVDPRGVGCSQVTFLYEAAGAENVTLSTQLNSSHPFEPMERVPGTDLWWAVRVAADDVRISYQFCVDDPLLDWDFAAEIDDAVLAIAEARHPRTASDPANPRRIRNDGPRWDAPVEHWLSVLTLAGTPEDPWHEPRAGVPAGSVDRSILQSRVLGNERGVSVYTPPGYQPDGGAYPLVVLLDGREFRHVVGAPTIVDNLFAERRIRPPLLAMVENPDELSRQHEYPCNASFTEFLADELLPWVRSRYGGTVPGPDSVVVGGASYGGLAAAHAGWSRSDVFDSVLSFSGAFWYSPEGEVEDEWLTRQIAAAERRPVRWWANIGILERQGLPGGTTMIGSNRHLRTVLEAKGYDVRYSEYSGGHDFASWRATLPQALVDLLGVA